MKTQGGTYERLDTENRCKQDAGLVRNDGDLFLQSRKIAPRDSTHRDINIASLSPPNSCASPLSPPGCPSSSSRPFSRSSSPPSGMPSPISRSMSFAFQTGPYHSPQLIPLVALSKIARREMTSPLAATSPSVATPSPALRKLLFPFPSFTLGLTSCYSMPYNAVAATGPRISTPSRTPSTSTRPRLSPP